MKKQIKLPMKFNPGLKKYEPDLPVKKGPMKSIKVDWWWIILISISIILIIFFFIYLLNEKSIVCTADAKLCPDGTAVGRIPPDCEFKPCPVSRVCDIDEDCIVFGKDGDCNCGCYNKDALPTSTGGKCFCAAPVSCECVENLCEGVF